MNITFAFVVALIVFVLTILFMMVQDIGPFVGGICLALSLSIIAMTYPAVLKGNTNGR